MADNDDSFTGAESLVPGTMQHAVHMAMMTNELHGGRGAYRIGDAVLAASGPSYGPFQYDLGANERARELFEEIASTAVDANGQRLIGDRDLAEIRSHLYQSFSNIRGSAAAQETYGRLLPAMNAALDSAQGRRLINSDYLAGIDAKVESVNAVIASVPDAANRALLEQNRLAQLIIADTANQYGSSVNEGLHQLLGMNSGSDPMQMPGRRRNPEQIGVDGNLGLEDLIRYKLETQYGQSNSGARDVLRRISNLIDAAGPENINLSEEDRDFLNSGLARYLADNGRHVNLEDRALSGFRRLTDTALRTDEPAQIAADVQLSESQREDFNAIFSVVERDGRWSAEESRNIAGVLLRGYQADPLMARLDAIFVGNSARDGVTNVFAVYQPFGNAGPFFHSYVDAGGAAAVPLQQTLQQIELDALRSQGDHGRQQQLEMVGQQVRGPLP